MKPMPLYHAVQRMKQATEPFSLTFVSLSLDLNEGGEIITLKNQLAGPVKKNIRSRYMIGLVDQETEENRHIYIHTILKYNDTPLYFT